MDFRKNVLSAIIELDISQTEITKGANITQACLSRCINGLTKPSAKTVFKIKAFLESKDYNWKE